MNKHQNTHGSFFRDDFRFKHKQPAFYSSQEARDRCMGIDVDFLEIRNGKIIAILDVKQEGKDDVTYCEKLGYKQLSGGLKVPIFIVESNVQFEPMTVWSYPDKKFQASFPNFKAYTKDFTEKIGFIIRTYDLSQLMKKDEEDE